MANCTAIIVGAGRGHRFGGPLPKQYRQLAGVPVVRHALRAFVDHPAVSQVVAVIHPDDRDLFEQAAAGLSIAGHTPGGAERQDSVRLGLEFAARLSGGSPPEFVLIHDAARPFVSERLISESIAALKSAPGAVPALAVADTLKRGVDDLVQETVDRSGLYRVQTPQAFRFGDIMTAHASAKGQTLTDDAAVAEAAGLAVALVPGDDNNFKITTEADLMRAEHILAAGETRTGFGFDVHRFEAGDTVRLCGVDIPFDQKLKGHSDADVGLHALTDAILGAVGEGDIGQHFPPTEAKWKGAESHIFLAHASDLVRDRNAAIVNVDVTIICEAPKVGPHRQAMAARIAEILNIDAGRVNVKATTTERLGFTGRGEGIAAQAVASVRYGVGGSGSG
ncbi:MAG: bifunctional 2-C-methyl-D-erythritol 4-phosphate cytidylyltransferase/2-C-methyl-D-erythritol 2,4-cyclodiphosphate synthase [Rhodospirillales bacterium]